ncbi:pentapeptide repeat-containing protein [Streptosporangium saharense]|uniref:pentapeptide repeat-containing protein n=1 Tax=Streptosporangium saharense TaxID=1706840 RepID=UPI003441A28D
MVTPPPLRTPRSALWWIVCVTVLVAVAVAATLWWLLDDPAAVVPTPNPGAAGGAGSVRGEMLRTALAAGAAVGAAVTLMLAFRRQHHQEVTAAHTTHDAVERRVTDLYTKAAEQIGHDAAAVRLAGLYALERLAQDNPGHRQTIVNVICAYLRMPWVSPPAVTPQGSVSFVPRAAIAGASALATGHDPHGELQVRLTAQRILEEHLRDDRTPDERTAEPADPRFWEGMRIDLTGATLIKLNFYRCHLVEATFDGATFAGNTAFAGATFTGSAWFTEATFTRDAWFTGATFTENVWFAGTTFTRDAWFTEVTFPEESSFAGTTFGSIAMFDNVTFARDAWFTQATFTGNASFAGAIVTGDARFHGVTAAPRNGHVWPDGWRLEVMSGGEGRLIADNAVDESGLAGDIPDEKARPGST